MENEEWEVLPGGTYSRAFLRTYASYLGLDGDRIAEDYREEIGPGAADGHPRPEPSRPVGRAPQRRMPAAALVLLACALLVGAVVAVGLISGGDGNGAEHRGRGDGSGQAAGEKSPATTAKPGVAVQLAASAEVWVCLLDDTGEPLINGEILEAGAEVGPFRAESFKAAFGNGEFELTIDGKPADTPPSASPVGYEIDSKGRLKPIEEGERPECT
jgi:hypothetical protein